MRNKNSKNYRILLWSGLFLVSMVLLIGPEQEPLFAYGENPGNTGTEQAGTASNRVAVVQEAEEDPEESENPEESEGPEEPDKPDESGESEADPDEGDDSDEESEEEDEEAPVDSEQDDSEEEPDPFEESSNEEGSSNGEDSPEKEETDMDNQESQEEASTPDLEGEMDSGEADLDTENDQLIRIPIEYNNENYYLWSIINNLELPDNFYLQKIAYEEHVIEVAYEDRNKMILVYLQKEEDSGDFYIYQPSRNLFHPYIHQQQQASFIPKMLREEKPPRGYARTTLQLEGESLTAWKHPDEELKDFYVLYGEMAGEEGFYLYDQEEKTLQRFIPKTEIETIIIQEQRVETKSAGTAFGTMTSDRRIMGLVLSLIITIFSLIIPIVYFNRSKKSIINVRYNDE